MFFLHSPNFQVLDDKNVRRRFRASNYQSTTRVKPFICTMPMRLDDGWNQIQFNLSDFTRRAYGTNYIETLRVQVSASSSQKVFDLKNSDPFFIFRSMQTVEYGECISPTDSTRRMSYQQSLSSICLSRTKKLRCRHTSTTFCLLNIYNLDLTSACLSFSSCSNKHHQPAPFLSLM